MIRPLGKYTQQQQHTRQSATATPRNESSTHKNNNNNNHHPCLYCKSSVKPEDSLFLECTHLLCVECAIKIISDIKTQQDDRGQYIVYRCDECGVESQINQELIKSLTMVEPAKATSLSYRRKSHKNSNMQMNLQKDGLITDSKTTHQRGAGLNRINSETERELSDDAESDDQSLFCLDCQTNCFSLDSYLDGFHKSHNVKSIAKAFPLLLQNTDELRQNMKKMADELFELDTKCTSRKREVLETTSNAKKLIKETFDQLRVTINNKQKDLYKELESFSLNYFAVYETKIKSIKDKLEDLQTFEEELHQNIYQVPHNSAGRPQQVEAFRYYNEKKVEINDCLQRMARENKGLQLDKSEKIVYNIDIDNIIKVSNVVRGVTLSLYDQNTKKASSHRPVLSTNIARRQKTNSNYLCAFQDLDTKGDEDYMSYFQKAKEDILRKNNEVQTALNHPPSTKSGRSFVTNPKLGTRLNSLFENKNTSNMMRGRSKSMRSLFKQEVSEAPRRHFQIPERINSSLQKYKLDNPANIVQSHLLIPGPTTLNNKSTLGVRNSKVQEDLFQMAARSRQNSNQEEFIPSASKLARERINRIETLFYQSLNRHQDQIDREMRSHTQY